MNMQEIIISKREGLALSQSQIEYFIAGYTNGSIPDYQVSALLMAIVLKGMNDDETFWLTKAMIKSGDVIDLSQIAGIKIDKHSTGGVGDKTSLALLPMVAACGCKCAKMSGRGLGHTGGTLDKLEAIKGFNIGLSEQTFQQQVNEIGLSIIGQSAHLVPADKKLYALRDVTGTVPAVPLIASSIMSKKLAAGSDTILLDVKFGDGAFMKTVAEATVLAEAMIRIGQAFGKDTRAMITDMNQPLGQAIGNALEVKEAILTLQNQGPQDFRELCLQAGTIILQQAQLALDASAARAQLEQVLANGEALAKFRAMVEYQGGDVTMIDHPETLPHAQQVTQINGFSGYVAHIDALVMGIAAADLGAGRKTKEDSINYGVGIVLKKKVGDFVTSDEILLEVHHDEPLSEQWLCDLRAGIIISGEPVAQPVLVHGVVVL
jgi:pyrimidine-nucleoside phosphorylase